MTPEQIFNQSAAFTQVIVNGCIAAVVVMVFYVVFVLAFNAADPEEESDTLNDELFL